VIIVEIRRKDQRAVFDVIVKTILVIAKMILRILKKLSRIQFPGCCCPTKLFLGTHRELSMAGTAILNVRFINKVF